MAVDRVPRQPRHRALGWFRDRWRVRRDVDSRPYFEASVLFQAADMAEAEALFDAMIDTLGCPDGDHQCPHFRVGGLHQVDDE